MARLEVSGCLHLGAEGYGRFSPFLSGWYSVAHSSISLSSRTYLFVYFIRFGGSSLFHNIEKYEKKMIMDYVPCSIVIVTSSCSMKRSI